jgi:hypothetical protein
VGTKVGTPEGAPRDDAAFRYDVALSFAGDDRGLVHPIAVRLREAGVRVFYDEFQQSEIWGNDLVVFFDEVFRKTARYAVVFISRRYIEKKWPTHEGRSALARRLDADVPYLLPVRLDDSELPGLQPTVGYIDSRITGQEQLVELILAKVGAARPVDRVPRTPSEEAYLISTRPPAWPYLLFAAVLLRERDSLASELRDHEIGYAAPRGSKLADREAWKTLESAMPTASVIAGNLDRLFATTVQERVFGGADEEGGAEGVAHLAARVIDIYRGLLNWSAELRGAVVSDNFSEAFRIAARFADGPVRQINEFVDYAVTQIDAVPSALREDTSEPIEISLLLKLDIDDGLVEEFTAELQRVASGLEFED